MSVDSVFRKTYRHDLRWQRQREIDFLKALDEVDGVPKLLAVDEDAIYMEDRGEQFTKESLQGVDLKEVGWMLDIILEAIWAVGVKHRDVTRYNLLWDGERLSLVDFGWSVWEAEEDTPEPVPQVMRWWMVDKSDEEQARETMMTLTEMKAGV